ncbi:MAG: BON domain-containing protein [Myxococcota bacterium]
MVKQPSPPGERRAGLPWYHDPSTRPQLPPHHDVGRWYRDLAEERWVAAQETSREYGRREGMDLPTPPPAAAPGPHRGHGPRGYARLDERIREEVLDALTFQHVLDATHVEVAVREGEVTLEGTVGSRRQKRAAEDLAEGVRGVRIVHNRLRVGPNAVAGGAS